MDPNIASQQETGRVESPWYPLKFAQERGEFHLGLAQLLGVPDKERYVCQEFYARLAHASMLEAGFVPLIDNIPAVPIEQLKGMSRGELMLKLLESLTTLRKQVGEKAMRCVDYTFVIGGTPAITHSIFLTKSENDAWKMAQRGVGSAGGKSLMDRYSPNPISMFIFLNTGGSIMYQVLLTDKKGFCMTFGLTQFFAVDWLDAPSYTAMEYLTSLDFKAMEFSDRIKKDLIYKTVDKYDIECPEIRGFDDLPPELLVRIGNELDTRTFVKFLATNRRNNQVLDTDFCWTSRYSNITEDLRSYGLGIPHQNYEVVPDFSLLPRLSYIARYCEAVELSRTLRQTAAWNQSRRRHINMPGLFDRFLNNR